MHAYCTHTLMTFAKWAAFALVDQVLFCKVYEPIASPFYKRHENTGILNSITTTRACRSHVLRRVICKTLLLITLLLLTHHKTKNIG